MSIRSATYQFQKYYNFILTVSFNPIQPGVAFLYSLKTSGYRKATPGCNGLQKAGLLQAAPIRNQKLGNIKNDNQSQALVVTKKMQEIILDLSTITVASFCDAKLIKASEWRYDNKKII